MKLRHTLLALCLLLFGASEAAPNTKYHDFGLGFALSSGYATASAHFPNGTYLDIAKIEGGQDYKAYMLGLPQIPPPIASAWYCPLPDQICQYWPMRSIIAHKPPDPMLKALVAAAEAALETTVESVAVSAHDLTNIDQEDVILALSRVGVESANVRMTGEVITQTLGSKNTWIPPHPYILLQHFLSVEYTRTSLSVFLLDEAGGNVTIIGKVSSGDFGYDAVQAYQAPHEQSNTTSTSCHAALKAAFRQMCRDTNQLDALDPDFGSNGQWGLDAIFVFGENARDQDLDTALREVLEAVWMDGERDDHARVVEDLSPDPAFAGSRAMALADMNEKRLRQGHAKREYVHDEV